MAQCRIKLPNFKYISNLNTFIYSKFQLTNISGEIPPTSSRRSKKETYKILLSMNSLAFDIGKIGLSKNLAALDLSNNKIYGMLPEGLTELKFLDKLNVSSNKLCGRIPQCGNFIMFDETCCTHNKCLCGSPLPPCKT
ncbi:polygalacturonase inhibitor 2-like [Trifolium medium]|uniref:Polygalacturonase inhibitor 2-like n=1 Tax=Trifolium medium TaxID=97028 RepID=A0A392PE87_9FABA|nr:polygalacturonase inhibitor 2-like [Trifolium medium]